MQLPLNVSPVSASFIGLQRRGIHLVLSLACSSFIAHSRARRFAAHGKHVQAFPLYSLVLVILSALGKIEVIILYSVVYVLSLLDARV